MITNTKIIEGNLFDVIRRIGEKHNIEFPEDTNLREMILILFGKINDLEEEIRICRQDNVESRR